MDADKLHASAIFPFIAIVVGIAVAGWVINTWLGSSTAIRSTAPGARPSIRRRTRRRSSG